MTHSTNDNDPIPIDAGSGRPDPAHLGLALPDPNGQAAILLVEGLIHGLIARSVLTVRDAIDIIDVASDVTQEAAEEWDGPDRPAQSPVTILESITASLSHDLPDN